MGPYFSVHNYGKCLIFFIVVSQTQAEYYSSVTGLEKLLSTEEDFITAVENYISNVEKVQLKIESFLDEIQWEHEKIVNNSNYFGMPTNSFSIIKRMVIDWKYYDELINMVPEFNDFNRSISLIGSKYTKANISDLQGAARGLSRLQNVYNLETEDLANGYILDSHYSDEMSAHDCFILGVSLYYSNEHFRASEWFQQALQILNNELYEDSNEDFPFISQEDILEYLPVSLFKGGYFKLAKIMNEKLLELNPENGIGLDNKELFKVSVVEERRLRTINKQSKKCKFEDLYAQVCRGELTQTDAEKRNLSCRFVTNNIPYYFIGPFKLEELNHDPDVSLYHQAIYDSEIEYIKRAVDNKIVRSHIGVHQYSENRTSKHAWLSWKEHDFLRKTYQRLEDITGLNMSTGEPLQVANYGIGGHYAPHYDFVLDPMAVFPNKENRLLTAMFYISDVELGGSTVFPYLYLTVAPVKNSLITWYNLHESNEFDYRMRHASCPVLKGSKWICNQWFHDVGQEFKRPCALQQVKY